MCELTVRMLWAPVALLGKVRTVKGPGKARVHA